MSKVFRALAALVAPLALSGCFLIPGQFGSTLDLRKDGNFAFTYTGEILFQSPDKMGKKAVWNVQGTHCYKEKGMDPYYNEEGVDEAAQAAADAANAAENAAGARTADMTMADDSMRPCTKVEIAGLRKTWDEEQAQRAKKDAKEADQFAQMFGFNPTDDGSMQKFATQLTKQAGWKSATYAGKGKFNVDYAISGKLDHDFVFPIIGDAQMMMPFVIIQRRADGAAMVTAPAFSAGTLGGLSGGLGGLLGGGGMEEQKPDQPKGTKGQFSITTNAEILTNNTTDGPVVMGKDRKLIWDVGAIKDPAPRAMFMVKP
ncbi:MAG: hypothetical protein RL367_859 [Pseudomonadota bacterium]